MKIKRLLATVLAFSFVMGTAAFAGTAVSKDKTFTVNGSTYKNNATIDAYPALAQSTVWVSGNKTLPAGYFGVSAILMKDGNTEAINGFSYSDSATTGLGLATKARTGVIGSNYYAYGRTEVFDGEDYVQKSTYNSPTQTVISSSKVATAGENGQIDIDAAIENNQMIPATGVDGVKGFIYPSDCFTSNVKTPAEALAKQKLRSSNKEYINLYASDGKTVIGKMEISYGEVLTK